MCGIAGIVRFDDAPINLSRAQAMLQPLRLRGPDDQAIEQFDRCHLAHARLSIIDPTGGGQPMSEATMPGTEPISVVFNGMIYNHGPLRKELESLGHRFTSDHSDTEVLLHGYRQWGTDLPGRLDGFFAFAIWHQGEHRLFLCRDRFGKKPLFIRQTSAELTFASLVAAVLAGGGDNEIQINPGVLLTYLQLGYSFDHSLVEGVEQLPAGHWMTVDATGRRCVKSYALRPDRSDPGSQPVSRDELSQALKRAVRNRLEADVPLGCFLSGGIDSSLVAALAQHELSALGAPPLQTFSVAMPQLDYDESLYAQQVVGHIGSRHTQLLCEPVGSVMADLDRLVRHTGQPTADSSVLPTYWLSCAARQHVKVALTGDGGDEIFAGYDRYRAMRLLQRHGWWLGIIPPGFVRPNTSKPRHVGTRLRRLLNAARFSSPSQQYRSIMQLFSDEQILAMGLALPNATQAMPNWTSDADPVTAALDWDRRHYLCHDLLRKTDRASMAIALELRCPLLDGELVDLAARCGPQGLMVAGRTKGLLRQIAGQWLPRAVTDRPKQGFALPVGLWFRRQLKDQLADHLFDHCLEDMGLQRRYIEKIFNEHARSREDHTHRLFALLSLSIWGRWFNEIKETRRS